MKALFLSRLEKSTVRDLNRLRDLIQVDPDYQREGDVWDLRRRQFLIDSILNGFDIPKLYLRHFVPAFELGSRFYEYAVIDGRQRLEALWAFLNDEFPLSKEFTYIDDPQVGPHLAGLRYGEISLRHHDISSEFMRYAFDVVTVETDDDDLIDDMFLRLNEAVPLNAAEKRNAFGGPIPALSHEVAQHDFFKRLKVTNRRYRYYEIATKFMYFEEWDRPRDTKKVYLDRFVTSMRGREQRAKVLADKTTPRLDLLAQIFLNNDYLLDTVGLISVYYLLAMRAMEEGWPNEITRAKLAEFQIRRQENRQAAFVDEAEADYDLLEFDRFAQSPNDAIALRFRRDLLLEFLGHPSDDPLVGAES